VAVGGMSELFQQQLEVNEGDSLRYAILIATGTVASLCAWLIYQASRSADADAQHVIGEFIAERTASRT
jgi:MFS transporter, Spinster family, sphingosine-1-phosphate transporter